MGKRVSGKQRSLLLSACLLYVSVVWSTGITRAAGNGDGLPSLQKLVDAAKPGETVQVPEGHYAGPLVVRKAIVLQASGTVVLTNPAEGPVLSIETDGAAVRGLSVKDDRDDPDSVTVYMQGSGNELSRMNIRSKGYGVRLHEAHSSKLTELRIEGMTEAATAQEVEPAERGNGIDLFGSHNNVIADNVISNMFDGVYMESSNSNLVERNTVTHSRYGYHLMFTKEATVRNNEGSKNVTGAMVMSDQGSKVIGNNFAKQSENATAQGILMFDVTGAVVQDNRIEGNRVGIFAQGVYDNRILDNLIVRNFTGMQMFQAERNDVMGNHFIANVVQAQAALDSSNRVESNYWDDLQGLDLKGEGYSDLAYDVNPFFLSLTERMPGYQIFFNAPGMMLLEGLFQGEEENGMSDAAPLMKPRIQPDGDAAVESGSQAWIASTALLLVSLSIIIIGGRRT